MIHYFCYERGEEAFAAIALYINNLDFFLNKNGHDHPSVTL
jgi:hypothetical protein